MCRPNVYKRYTFFVASDLKSFFDIIILSRAVVRIHYNVHNIIHIHIVKRIRHVIGVLCEAGNNGFSYTFGFSVYIFSIII
jgi:hypothetical protein